MNDIDVTPLRLPAPRAAIALVARTDTFEAAPPPMPPPQPPPFPQKSPVNVEALALNGNNGEIIGVTDIRIANAGDPSDGVEQSYPASDRVQMATLELSDAFPGGHYNIGVNWANGARYRSDVPDFDNGNYITVDAPNA